MTEWWNTDHKIRVLAPMVGIVCFQFNFIFNFQNLKTKNKYINKKSNSVPVVIEHG